MMSSRRDLHLAKPLLPFSIRSLTDTRPPSYNFSISRASSSTIKTLQPSESGTEENGKNARGENELPRSVRGAPRHLRAIIRKRQNSESAKRSRQRKNNQRRELAVLFEEQVERIYALEARVAELVRLVAEEERQEVIRKEKEQRDDIRLDFKGRDRAGGYKGAGNRADEIEEKKSEEGEPFQRDIIRLLDMYIERAACKNARVEGAEDIMVQQDCRVLES